MLAHHLASVHLFLRRAEVSFPSSSLSSFATMLSVCAIPRDLPSLSFLLRRTTFFLPIGWRRSIEGNHSPKHGSRCGERTRCMFLLSLSFICRSLSFLTGSPPLPPHPTLAIILSSSVDPVPRALIARSRIQQAPCQFVPPFKTSVRLS
jgi:hypothetical protein